MNLPRYETEVQVHIEGIEGVKAFVKETAKFDFDIDILDGARHYVIDAKSIMGIFSLDLSKDLIVGTHAEGAEVAEFIEAMKQFAIK